MQKAMYQKKWDIKMAFIEFDFYIFLAVCVGVYYLIPLRWRWVSLLAASAAFYSAVCNWSAAQCAMLLGTALICWLLSLLMQKQKKRKRFWLVLALLAAALPLLLVKEAPFAVQLLHKALPSWWVAPVGIAFYSLQLIAYTVDVYKGKTVPEQNPFKFLLFVSFFPQIIQGPIPRYNQLAPQLLEGHRFDEDTFVKGGMLILWGFFLKLCIADKAGIYVDQVFDQFPTYQGAYVLLAGVLYSIQLYTDFLACTSFAQGIAELYGIRLIDNFWHPYFATSIKDFWRRWHISLSSWLRDYIYIPLGGNRKGKGRKYINLLATFAVSGIWHGAGYKFLFWGLLHGGYQIAGDALSPVKKQLSEKMGIDAHPNMKKALDRTVTFILVMLAWIIFRAEHLSTGIQMIRSIFTVQNPWILTNDILFTMGLAWKEWGILLLCIVILCVVSSRQEKGVHIREQILSCSIPVRWAMYIGMILFIVIFGTYGFGFDAQAFIYGGF